MINEVKTNIEQVYNNLSDLDKTISSRGVSISREKIQNCIQNLLTKNIQKSESKEDKNIVLVNAQTKNEGRSNCNDVQPLNNSSVEEYLKNNINSNKELFNRSSICEMVTSNTNLEKSTNLEVDKANNSYKIRESIKIDRSVDICKQGRQSYEAKSDRLRSIIKAFKDVPNSNRKFQQINKGLIQVNLKYSSKKPAVPVIKNWTEQFISSIPDKTNKVCTIKAPDQICSRNNCKNERIDGKEYTNITKNSVTKKHLYCVNKVDRNKITLDLIDEQKYSTRKATSPEFNRNREIYGYKKFASIKTDIKNITTKYLQKNNKNMFIEQYRRNVVNLLPKDQENDKSLTLKPAVKPPLVKQNSNKKLFCKS